MSPDARVPLKAKPSNKPYTPIFYDGIREPWRGLLAKFLRFCEHVTIQSKDEGPCRLILKVSQRYFVEEIFWGFSQGIHDFVCVKARQLGISTILWAFDLFWLTTFSLQGLYVTDGEENKEIHRDILQEMYKSLPPTWSRGPARVASRLEMAWADTPTWKASRLMWAFANRAKTGQLGRSRGTNYGHYEEMDSWGDPDAPTSLDAARSSSHPRRAYFYVGTGQGYGLLYDLYEQALDSTTRRVIFVGFWRDPTKVVTRAQRAQWAAYGREAPNADEMEWITEVKKRYDVRVTREQLAWWRWTLNEGIGINGKIDRCLQEHPWIPEHAFQPTGSKFLSTPTAAKLRADTQAGPAPKYFRYEWGPYFDSKGDDALIQLPEEAKDAATLTIYEDPEPGAVYVLGADPSYGSSPRADRMVITLCKAFPDALIEVAKYSATDHPTYQFAWVLVHLCGTYQIDDDTFWAVDVNGPGLAVDGEIKRMLESGFGITKPGRQRLQDAMNTMRRFLERRTDTMTESPAWHFHATQLQRMQMFEQLRDSCERGAFIFRSRSTVEEICALVIDEHGWVAPGGILNDDEAFAAGLANRTWLQNVIPEIEDRIAPLETPRNAPRHVGETMLRGFLNNMDAAEQAGEDRPYGLPRVGPGRGRR